VAKSLFYANTGDELLYILYNIRFHEIMFACTSIAQVVVLEILFELRLKML